MDGLQNKKSQLMGFIFIIVLMIGTFIYVFRGESPSKIFITMTKIDTIYIVIGIGLMLFYVLCEGFNIWITMKALNKKTCLKDCLGYGFVGFYFSGITPSASGGQPAQVYFMKKDGLSITSSSLSLMIILFAHQLVIIVYGIVGLFNKLEYNFLNVIGLKLLLVYGFLSNTFILVGILLLIFSPKLAYKIVNFFGILLYKFRLIKKHEKIKNKINKSLEEYSSGARYMRENPIVMTKVTVVTFIQVTAQFAIPYIFFKAFNLTGYSIWSIICIQAILNIAVSSLPLPGAVGASESVFINIFKGMFGPTLVIPGMLLTRISNFYTLILISGIISLVLFLKSKKVNTES